MLKEYPFLKNRDRNKIFDIGDYQTSLPFNHVVMDNFFIPDVARRLSEEFPDFNSNVWPNVYNSPIEKKKLCSRWDAFPSLTYSVMQYFCSPEYVFEMRNITGIKVMPDYGLNGAGWHVASRNGKLNIHKDYSMHPKLHMERRLNLLVYLTPDWDASWGGGLELWSNNTRTNTPLKCEKIIHNKFNRAVLFDTSQDSWHGLPTPISCPENIIRKHLAMYYVSSPRMLADERPRALFAPTAEQSGDKEILNLIEKRARLS